MLQQLFPMFFLQRLVFTSGCALFLLIVASCSPQEDTSLSLTPIAFSALPAWNQQNHDSALESFKASCRKFSTHPATIPQQIAGKPTRIAAWQNACSAAAKSTNAALFFKEYFQPYQATTNHGLTEEGLVTGYYEPLLKGSREKTAEYPYPVWGTPRDIKAGSPYLSHQEIDTLGLAGKSEILLYVNDKIDLFFLQIQGSGRVQLPDGEVVRLAYAGKNGHPYTAIGRYLIDRNIIPRSELSAPRLKQWLRENPEEGQAAMYQNASYVFFKWGDSATNAVGAQGVPLTPEASIAVDPTHLPYGVPVYLDTHLPYSNEKYRKLVVAQDTGGAIKGALRADLFTGFGDRAEHIAGGMKQMARFFILLPK